LNGSGTVPSSLTPGTYYVWVLVDDDRQISGQDTSNDRLSVPVTVSGVGTLDLMPTGLVISPNPVQAGQTLSFSFTVRNSGLAMVTSTTITRVRLSRSGTTVTQADPLLASLPTPPLAARASLPLNGSGTVPSSLTPGTYYVWVLVDDDRQINGQDKNNDSLAVPVMVTSPGMANQASLISETDPGGLVVPIKQNYIKRWTLKNTGTSTWDSRYSLQHSSGNAGCNHNAVPVTGTVAPGATYTFSVSCTAPATANTYREDWMLVGPSGSIPINASPTVHLILVVKPSQTPEDAMTLVSETVPNGSRVSPNEDFIKVWRLKNSGTTTWANYRAVYVQNPGGGVTNLNLHSFGASIVPVPVAAPGDIIDLSLPMRAPTAPGSYMSYWQLQNAVGAPFGPLLDVRIEVQSSGTTIRITPRQSYDPSTRTLVLAANAVDSLSRPVTTGSFNWSLRDSGGAQMAAGSLIFQGGEWGTRYMMPMPLPAGLYNVQYSLSDGSRSGSAVGSFSVGDLVEISGVVRDGRSRAPLSGVEVRAGGKLAQTDGAGKYVLSGLNPYAIGTISVAKPGYTPYDAPLDAFSGSRTIVRDFDLFPSSPSRPVVTGLTAQYEGTFLAGVPFTNRYTALVTWNGNPGNVEFYYDGKLVASVPGTSSGASAAFDIGGSSSSSPVIRTLRVIARNQAGATSEPWEKKIAFAPIPRWLKDVQAYILCGPLGALSAKCVSDLSFVALQKQLRIPLIGPIESKVKLGGGFEYDARSAQVWIRPTGELELKKGLQQITGTFKGGASGIFLNGWRIEDLRVDGSIEGETKITEIPLGQIGAVLEVLEKLTQGFLKDLGTLPIYLIVGADGQIRFIFGEQTKVDGEISGSMGFKGGYEPKVGNIFDLEATLSAISKAELYPNLLENYSVIGLFEFKVRWRSKEYRYEAVLFEYPTRTGQGAWYIAIPISSSDAREGFRPLKRDYLNAGPPRFQVYEPSPATPQREAAGVAAIERFRQMGLGYRRTAEAAQQAELPIISNTFPYSEPSLAARGSELMLVYVADSSTADAARFTDIHYTFFDGNDWSVPAPISTDPRMEFAPKVAFDGNGDAIAVWEREKDTTLGPDASIEAYASKLEIVWSRWDRATRSWSTPVPLTDNDHLDHLPLLVGPMEDGGLIAVWTDNPSNLLVGSGAEGSVTSSRVWWARWDAQSRSWGQPGILVSSVVGRSSQGLAGAGRRAIYAWTQDTDGDPNTSSDQELFYASWDGQSWSPILQVTRDEIPDRNVQAAVTSSGEVSLVWQRGSDLVFDQNFSSTPTVIRPDSGTLSFEDFTLTAGPSGNLVVLWQGRGPQGTDVFYRVFDPASGSWSEDMQLTNDRDLERSFAATWDSAGNLTLVYNLVAVNEVTKSVTLDDGTAVQVEGALEFGQVDLRVLKRALRRDVGFRQGGLIVDCAPCLPGQTATVQARVENLGDLPVSDVTVAFYAGDPSRGGQEIARVAIPSLLRAGESAPVEVQWVPAGPYATEYLLAVVDPDNRINESDETNNTVYLQVGGPDLSLSLRKAAAEPDGSARIVVEVRNNGTIATDLAELIVTSAGATASSLARADVLGLGLGESAEVALVLPPGSLRGEGSEFEVSVVYAGDVNTENNTINVSIQPTALELKTVATPVVTPQGGQFTGPISATITCDTEGAVIRYTTNGKDPTEDDPIIPSGATVPITSSVVLKAKAWKSGWTESAVRVAIFTVSDSPTAVSQPVR
jgi:hypothetical protein